MEKVEELGWKVEAVEYKRVKFDLDWKYGLDLHLHGSEEEGKTEEATEQKKQKARKEGQVVLTQELPQTLSLVVALVAMFLLGKYYFFELSGYLNNYLENSQTVSISDSSLPNILRENVFFLMKLLLPLSGAVIVVSVLATMLQTKFLISPKNLKFNFSKVAPTWKNFVEKTIFSRNQILNALKIIVKVTAILLITYFFILQLVPDLWGLAKLNVLESFEKMNFWVFELSLFIAGFMLLLVFPDWLIQRAEYLRKLRMSRDEVKKEMKESEGDPQIKQKQRQRAKEIAMSNMSERVKSADVIITNPTHYACAIAYDQSTMDVPKVVMKGEDMLALRIRKIANENDIPIIENKPLARAIYAQVEIDEYIPEEFYLAIAEILRTLDTFNKDRATVGS